MVYQAFSKVDTASKILVQVSVFRVDCRSLGTANDVMIPSNTKITRISERVKAVFLLSMKNKKIKSAFR